MPPTKYMFMVNKKLKRGCIAYPFLIISWLIVTNTCDAQKISRYYKSSVQGNSTLYFVMPDMKFSNVQKGGTFFFDITILTSNDSATVNFSFIDNSIRQIDSLLFVLKDKWLSSNSKKIFIEPQKARWNHRYTSKFSLSDFMVLFAQENRPKVVISSKSGIEELEIRQGVWKRNAAIVTQILTMIKLSKEK